MPSAKTSISPLTLASTRFTRGEVQLWNWFNRTFAVNTSWRTWLNEIWTPLLDRCVGREMMLHRRAAVSGQDEQKTYRFKSNEVVLGRDPQSDIILTPRSIAPRHCRIILQDGFYFIEDLGSPLGIYLNKRKMKPNERVAINEGDEFSIFPYRFTFQSAPVWAPESSIQANCAGPKPCTWSAFSRNQQNDAARFSLEVHPSGVTACVETSRFFLEQIFYRFLRPWNLPENMIHSIAAEAGVLEFLVMAVLERANQSLRFPFRVGLRSDCADSAFDADERGFELLCNLGLSQLTGAFRLFLPATLLERVISVPMPASNIAIPVSWQLAVCAGSVAFTPDELVAVETGDIVLVDRRLRLLLPGASEKGWLLDEIEGNENHFRVTTCFERFDMSEINNVTDMTGKVPDISRLPIRLDVVIAEKEFTLREIQELAEGSIVEVYPVTAEPVQVKLNGKPAGDGELVEIDGRLGIRITRWGRTA